MNSVRCPFPQKGVQKRTVAVFRPNFEQSVITSKRYEIRCQLLVLITNRKSHMSFRLVPTSVTLNDLERRNNPFLHYFTELDSFGGRLRHNG